MSEDKPTFSRGTVRVFDEGLYWEFDGRRRRAEDINPEAHVDDLVTIPHGISGTRCAGTRTCTTTS